MKHTLDIVHCEKQMATTWLKCYLGRYTQLLSKNNMESIGISLHLWLWQVANGSYIKPIAPYVMTNEEKNVFLQTIKKLKTPTNCARALRNRVQKDKKSKGLKSHDYHIMLQVFPLPLYLDAKKRPRCVL
jgi:hypothetical protein